MVLLGPASAVRAADSWLMSGHDASNSGFNSGEHLIGPANVRLLRAIWTTPIRSAASVVATDRFVFAISPARTGPPAIEVIDAKTGKLLRTFGPVALRLVGQTDFGAVAAALVYAHGRIIVGEPAHAIVALDPNTGRTVWRVPVGADSLTVWRNTLFSGNLCDAAVPACRSAASLAVNITNGKVLWRHPGIGGGRPILATGLLYQWWYSTAGPSTRVYALNSGQLLGTLRLGGAWLGDAHHAYLDTVTGGPGQSLEMVGPTGKPAWSRSLGRKPSAAPPALAYETLYSSSYRFQPGIIAADALTGKLRWASDLGAVERLVVANGLLFALKGTAGEIDAVNARTGVTARRVTPPHLPADSPFTDVLISGGTLYEVGQSAIIAYRP